MKAIITADWHLRSTRPRCRLDDDWMATQLSALKQVSALSKKYDCPVIVVGDIFDTAASDVSFTLLNMIQDWAAKLSQKLYLIAGNHDLQYHDIVNLKKSALGILLGSANVFDNVEIHSSFEKAAWAYNFGEDRNLLSAKKGYLPEIIFLHRLTFPNLNSIPPNVKASTAADLLKEFPGAQYIFTGDYHRHFIIEKKGRYVINPGCLLRQSANEKEYEPQVVYVDTETNFICTHPIEDNTEMVTDEYLRDMEQRENRIDAFVELLKTKGSLTLDFIKNVEARIGENKQLETNVVSCIRELIYEG